MTVDELVGVLQEMQKLGYGSRKVTHYEDRQLDPTQTVEITGAFAGIDAFEDEVVLEAAEWEPEGYDVEIAPV